MQSILSKLTISKMDVLFFILRFLLAWLFIGFGLDKMTHDLEDFIDNIDQFKVFPMYIVTLTAHILPSLEILVGIGIMLPSNYSNWLFKLKQYSYYLMGIFLLSFCLLLIRGLLLQITDCGCGSSFNPLDYLGKKIWYWISGIQMPSMEASLVRNFVSILFLYLSFPKNKKSHQTKTLN